MVFIDQTRLRALRDDIGEDCFADVATMFIGEIDAHMRKLLANPAQAKPADFHYMHGSAANMGFSALATACKAAEDACHTGNLPDMAGIEMAFHGALDDLQAAMPNILLPA